MGQQCGVPTLTCVFLILFMGALYAKASTDAQLGRGEERSAQEVAVVRDAFANVDYTSRGRQGRIVDSAGPTVGRRRPGGGRRRRPGSRRRIPGSRRGGSRGSRGRQQPGSRVGRRTLRRGRRLSNATVPFSSRLLGEMFPALQHDMVFSPHSIHAVMSMVLLGARGSTERQIRQALGLRSNRRLRGVGSHRAYQALLTSLRHTHRDVHVLMANGVFVRPNIPLELNFRRQLQIMYSAKFDSFNMTHPDGPEAPINQWVSHQTRGKIGELLPSGSIGGDTAMVLVNTLYLNATWARPFNRRLTREMDFYSLSTGTKRIDTMETTSMFKYTSHHDTEIVELPYKGGRLSMIILLPVPSSNISQLLQYVTTPSQGNITGTTSPMEVLLRTLNPTFMRITLPKFQIDSGLLDVKQPLRRMGITKAFNPGRANFTGISVVDLHVDDVIHKAVIQVNEDGTTAAAASAVYFGLRLSPMQPRVEMNVNRPFMFLIRDTAMNNTLFMGAFMGQSQQEVEGA